MSDEVYVPWRRCVVHPDWVWLYGEYCAHCIEELLHDLDGRIFPEVLK